MGFTLIELSMSLIIIGLTVGGILTGKELIQNATNRGDLRQIEEFDSATKTFQLKFNSLPGDITPERARGFGLYARPDAEYNPAPPYLSPPPNGDGILQDRFNHTVDNADIEGGALWSVWVESYFFFVHLSNAGLIQGKYIDEPYNCDVGPTFPPLKTNNQGGITAITFHSNIWWYLGLPKGVMTDDFCWAPPFPGDAQGNPDGVGVMKPATAYYIDSKKDDGVPNKGIVQAVRYIDGTIDDTPSACVTDATSTVYNINDQGNRCRLLIKAQ
jgi:hypothetical protein